MLRPSARAMRRTALLSTVVLAAGATVVALEQTDAFAAATATINGATTYQTIDGFGFSEAFQRSRYLHGSAGLSTANQAKVLDLLFNTTTGAGFSILRNGIGSSTDNSSDFMKTIAPTKPATPTTEPTWSWDGSDNDQVWLSQQAVAYGVKTIYADAWSAPGYMKTNNSDSNGGTLCGVPNASCSSGDWRQAYATMLAKYISLYAAAGVPITHVGFLNEPDYTTGYASMNFDGTQAADFIKVLSKTLAAQNLNTKIVCCEATGWGKTNEMNNAIASDSTAWSALGTVSTHGYGGAPTSPLSKTGKPTWQTEWSTFDNWSTAWDNGQDNSGYSWADKIMTGLTSAGLTGFLYWWGAHEKTNNEGLIQLNGNSYQVSSRLWAFANYSRYIRPGAVRIAASGSDGNVGLAAFKNTDGTLAIVALNRGSSASSTTFSLTGTGITSGTATGYLTNGSNNTAAQSAVTVSGGSFSASIPARSLVTYKVTAGGQPSSSATSPSQSPSVSPSSSMPTSSTTSSAPQSSSSSAAGSACRVGYVTSAWNTGLTANVTITNTGDSPIDGWSLAFTLPSGQRITSGWNASYSPDSGAVTATNVSYNGAIAAGASTTIGFQATHTGDSAAPTAFTLNGTACGTG